ncbi:prepilin-type N-terminal cleavage/methylation domain-containing protein [Moraxella sp. DOX410]|nr:prepilin-type N-terminal cleavage/methylation domain-containing protein [Moraxella sp. DOX410]WNP28100.1 prepilin-type N-terminal cleavage/methylation domain-containing protein [Moraxella sp. DOX410]
MNRHKGFTLIELMVTVAMVAILASIAIPSYRQYAIRNAESQAQAKMKQLEIELNRWRATSLTYKGFLPKKIASDGTVSYGYDETDNKTIYVPANSTSSNYHYKILLVDGDNTANSLVPTASSTLANSLTAGRAWVMFATPNPTKFNDAHKILLTSSGTQCKTKNSDTSVTIASTNCGTYSETW